MDETFFSAQRRHRRTARAYAALAAVAALLQAVPAAVMLLPVTLGTAVLVTDVVNLVTPMPDLAAGIGEALDTASARERSAGFDTNSVADVAGEVVTTTPREIFGLALLPGLLGMVALWWLAQRFLLRDGLGGVLVSAGGRPPNRADAEEHQLANIVEELSIAAGIQPPRLLVLPADVPNAAAFGRGPDRATIAVSRRLLDDLDREATQGVVAHLVASIANGDLWMRHALLAVFLAYALAADLLLAPFSPNARRRLRGAWRMLRGRAGPEEEASAIRDLLQWNDDEGTFTALYGITWRLAQFWTNMFVVGGFLALPFRARKYLADATAVQLARTPDGLGRALVHLDSRAKPLPGAEWASIYAITSPVPKAGDDGLEDAVTLPASLHPALHRRVRRLRRLGFTGMLLGPPRIRSERVARWPWPLRILTEMVSLAFILVVFVPLVLLLFAVALGGLLITVELSTLFYAAIVVVVVLPLHLLLRFLA
jgi:Zn-dependent protease with chaperone function